jgi:hypothetical protein
VTERVTKLVGLASQYSPLSMSPGALLRANDCSMRRENVIEDRRGYKLYATLSANAKTLLNYNNRVIAHRGTTLEYDNGSGTFASYSGSYSEPTGKRIRACEAFSNLYITTSEGIKVLSDLAGTSGRLAGIPRALDISYSLAGSSGFLSDTKQCAYRCVVQKTDANSNVHTGYPSQRLWVTNSAGGTRNVTLTSYLPTECVAGDKISFYRTEQFAGVSEDLAGDEMGLVYIYELTATEISAGLVTFTDIVVDALRGATLYTSPSQEGIAQANDRPPLACDVAEFKDHVLYANTQTKQRLFSTLLSVSQMGRATTADTNSTDQLTNIADTTNIVAGWKVEGTGIPVGTTVSSIVGSTVTLSAAASATAAGVSVKFYTNRTVTLAGTAYNFGSTEILTGAGSPQVQVSTTAVAAADIDLTARSFIKVINRCTANTLVYAYYLSGPDDTPGQMMFEERGLGASAFTIQASHSSLTSQFSANLPVVTATTTQCTSTNDVRLNYIYVSKKQQGEHVPTLNYLPVGKASKAILRIISLRDSVIVIKEDGVFRVFGEVFSQMSVTAIDKTVICASADSVVELANQVIMLSNQGVVLISETGAQVISRDIEPDIAPLLQSTYLATNAIGLGYESERSYYLSTLTTATDTAANQTLVFNIFTKTWVVHTYAFNAAVIVGDKMVFTKASDPKVYQERKSYDDTDYADPESTITLVSISGSTITFTISGSAPLSGWVVLQGTTGIAIDTVTEVAGLYTAVLREEPPSSWAAGSATLYPAVNMDIEFHSWTSEAGPGMLKQVRGVGFLTDDIPGNNSVSLLAATFTSNFDPELEEIEIEQPGAGWGAAWGSSPWGGTGDSNGYPTLVPRNKQYCNRLRVGIRHRNAREHLVIVGYVPLFEVAQSGGLGK